MTAPETPALPIKEGLLGGDFADLATVRLRGTRCAACGETSLGTREVCANCGSRQVTPCDLGRNGRLWSYTVVRHRPPGNYRGAEPFRPFGVGLVELPEGIRVFSTLSGAVDDLRIGEDLVFTPFLRGDDDGRRVVAFTFAPSRTGDRP